MAENKKLRVLYDRLASHGVNVGTFEKFENTFGKDEDGMRTLHDRLASNGVEVGTFEKFRDTFWDGGMAPEEVRSVGAQMGADVRRETEERQRRIGMAAVDWINGMQGMVTPDGRGMTSEGLARSLAENVLAGARESDVVWGESGALGTKMERLQNAQPFDFGKFKKEDWEQTYMESREKGREIGQERNWFNTDETKRQLAAGIKEKMDKSYRYKNLSEEEKERRSAELAGVSVSEGQRGGLQLGERGKSLIERGLERQRNDELLTRSAARLFDGKGRSYARGGMSDEKIREQIEKEVDELMSKEERFKDLSEEDRSAIRENLVEMKLGNVLANPLNNDMSAEELRRVKESAARTARANRNKLDRFDDEGELELMLAAVDEERQKRYEEEVKSGGSDIDDKYRGKVKKVGNEWRWIDTDKKLTEEELKEFGSTLNVEHLKESGREMLQRNNVFEQQREIVENRDLSRALGELLMEKKRARIGGDVVRDKKLRDEYVNENGTNLNIDYADKFRSDTERILNSPDQYLADRQSFLWGLGQHFKGMDEALLNVKGNWDALFNGEGEFSINADNIPFAGGVVEAVRYKRIAEIAEKSNEDGSNLTKDEKVLLQSYMTYLDAVMEVESKQAMSYRSGQGGAQSMVFMAEMLLFAGAEKLIGKGAAKGAAALAQKLASVKGVNMSAKLQRALLNVGEKSLRGMSQFAADANGAYTFKYGGKTMSVVPTDNGLRKLGAAVVNAGIETGVTPRTYGEIEKKRAEVMSTEGRDLTSSEIAWILYDQWAEYFSESGFNALNGAVTKGLVPKWASRYMDKQDKWARYTAGRFRNAPEEFMEEYERAAMDLVAGHLFGNAEVEEQGKHQFTLEGTKELAAGMWFQTLLMGGGAYAVTAIRGKQLDKKREALISALASVGSREDAEGLVSVAETSDDLGSFEEKLNVLYGVLRSGKYDKDAAKKVIEDYAGLFMSYNMEMGITNERYNQMSEEEKKMFMQKLHDGLAGMRDAKLVGEAAAAIEEKYGLKKGALFELEGKQSKDMSDTEVKAWGEFVQEMCVNGALRADIEGMRQTMQSRMGSDGVVRSGVVDGKRVYIKSEENGIVTYVDGEGNVSQTASGNVSDRQEEDGYAAMEESEQTMRRTARVTSAHPAGSLVVVDGRLCQVLDADSADPNTTTSVRVQTVDEDGKVVPMDVPLEKMEGLSTAVLPDGLQVGKAVARGLNDAGNVVLEDENGNVEEMSVMAFMQKMKEQGVDLVGAIDGYMERGGNEGEVVEEESEGVAAHERNGEGDAAQGVAAHERPEGVAASAEEETSEGTPSVSVESAVADVRGIAAENAEIGVEDGGREYCENVISQSRAAAEKARKGIEKKRKSLAGETDKKKRVKIKAEIAELEKSAKEAEEKAAAYEGAMGELFRTEQERVEEMAGKLGVKVRFVSREELGKDNVEGYYNTETGEIVLCPENCEEGRMEFVLFHETVGHYGLRQLFQGNVERMGEMLDAIYAGMTKGDIEARVRECEKNPRWEKMSERERVRLVAEEHFARTAEEYLRRKNEGTLSEEIEEKAKSIFERFMEVLRELFGIKAMGFDDVMALAAASARNLEKRKPMTLEEEAEAEAREIEAEVDNVYRRAEESGKGNVLIGSYKGSVQAKANRLEKKIETRAAEVKKAIESAEEEEEKARLASEFAAERARLEHELDMQRRRLEFVELRGKTNDEIEEAAEKAFIEENMARLQPTEEQKKAAVEEVKKAWEGGNFSRGTMKELRETAAEVAGSRAAVEILTDTEPRSVAEVAAQMLGSGKTKITKYSWTEDGRRVRSGVHGGVMSETGMGESEMKRFPFLFVPNAPNGENVLTLEGFAERVEESCRADGIPCEDTQEARNAVIEVIQGAEVPTDFKEYIVRGRMAEARRLRNDEVNMTESELMRGVMYSVVTDKKLIDKLESGEKIRVYRAMAVDERGRLIAPMASEGIDNGRRKEGSVKPSTEVEGQWQQAEEHREAAVYSEKDGYAHVTIRDDAEGATRVAYNPYIHTSRSMLNDQFAKAWRRPNMVVVECEVPKSELTSGYKAEWAKNSVGETEWKSGPVAGSFKVEPRRVVLTRWAKPLRIVPMEEYAESVKGLLERNGVLEKGVPFNCVTPEQRDALAAVGVPIAEPKGNGRSEASVAAYEEWRNSGVATAENREAAHERTEGIAEEVKANDGSVVRKVGEGIEIDAPDGVRYSIKVYHGSAADFKEFDHSFMGSGEGAQAYGWGTYVSAVKGISKAYADTAKRNAEYRQKQNKGWGRNGKIFDGEYDDGEYTIEEFEAIQILRLNENDFKEAFKVIEDNIKDSVSRLNRLKILRESESNWEIDNSISVCEDTIKRYKGVRKVLEDIRDGKSDIKFIEGENKPVERHLYEVEIPDDNTVGRRSLDEIEDEMIGKENIGNWYYRNKGRLSLDLGQVQSSEDSNGREMDKLVSWYNSRNTGDKLGEEERRILADVENEENERKSREIVERVNSELAKFSDEVSAASREETGEVVSYLDWDGVVPNSLGLIERIESRLLDRGHFKDVEMFRLQGIKNLALDKDLKGGDIYKVLCDMLWGRDKEASQLLSELGVKGVKVSTNYHRTGYTAETKNYVIFNEKDARIVDNVMFSVRPEEVSEVVEESERETEEERTEREATEEKVGVAGAAVDVAARVAEARKSEPKYQESGFEGEGMRAYFERYAAWRESVQELEAADEKAQEEYRRVFGTTVPRLPQYQEGMSTMEYIAEYKRAFDAMQDVKLVGQYNEAIGFGRKTMIVVKRVLFDKMASLGEWQRRMAKELGMKELPTEYDTLGALMRMSSAVCQRIADYGDREQLALHRAVGAISREAEVESGKVALQEVRGAWLPKLIKRPKSVKFKDVNGNMWSPGWMWQNVDDAQTLPGDRRNGQLLSPLECIEIYLQAKDALEAEDKGLPNRGLEGFANQLSIEGSGEKMSAKRVVAEFEKHIGTEKCEALSAAVFEATKFSMEEMVRGGLITRAAFNETMMYNEETGEYGRKHYVPQRGWAYEAYLDETMFADAMTRAKGRRTLATNPIAYIDIIAMSSVTSAERNLAKQSVYRLAKYLAGSRELLDARAEVRRLQAELESLSHAEHAGDAERKKRIKGELEKAENRYRRLTSAKMERVYEYHGIDPQTGAEVIYETTTRPTEETIARNEEIYKERIMPLTKELWTLNGRLTKAKKALENLSHAEPQSTQSDAEEAPSVPKRKKRELTAEEKEERKRELEEEIKRLEKEIEEKEKELERARAQYGHVKIVTRNSEAGEQKYSAHNKEKVQVFVDGERYDVKMERSEVARNINGFMDNPKVDEFLHAWREVLKRLHIEGFTKWRSSMLTQFNPVFAVSNYLRDARFAFIINSVEHNPVFAAKVLGLSFDSVKCIRSYIKGNLEEYGKKHPETAALFREFMDGGGITGYSFAQELPDITKKLDAAIKKVERKMAREEAKGKHKSGDMMWVRMVFEEIKNTSMGDRKENVAKIAEYLSKLSELMTRFAQYRVVRGEQKKKGIEDIGAAINEAKEITTNFNRSGEIASLMGPLFYFTNATLQGGYRIIRAGLKHPGKIMGVNMLFSAAGFLLAMSQPDDPDDETFIPDYVWKSYAPVGRVRFVLPHYFRTWFYMGANVAFMLKGKKSVHEGVLDAFAYMIDDNLPTPMNMLSAVQINKALKAESTFESDDEETSKMRRRNVAPSAIQPLVDLRYNRKFTGAKIYKEPYNEDENLNDVLMYYKNTNGYVVEFCKWLQMATGGKTGYEHDHSGVTWNPAKVQYLLENYFSGAPLEFVKTVLAAKDVTEFMFMQGDEPEWDRMPLVGRFYQPYKQDRMEDAYYWDLKEIMGHWDEWFGDIEKHRRDSDEARAEYEKWRDSEKNKLYREIEGPFNRISKKLKEGEPLENEEIEKLMEWNRRWNELSEGK